MPTDRVAGGRRWLLVLGLGCAAAMLGCAPAPSRPNLVLVVIDTLRADHLGAYGYRSAQTPRLDGLAARGTRFTAAHASASWTLPSVVSMLTGRYPVEHGVEQFDSALNPAIVTIAETLQGAGYETAAFSANAAMLTAATGIDQGFDRYEVVTAEGADPAHEGAKADRVTDAVLAWLGSRADPARPYFLYVHYFDPHSPYAPPPEFASRFGVRADDPLYVSRGGLPRFGEGPPAAAVIKTLTALYDAEIAFNDGEVGRLCDGLQLEKPAGPIVVVTADHGEEFGEHGGMQHGRTLFEEVLRVPLLMAGTGIPSGTVIDTPVSLVSIAATLADLANLGSAPSLPGSSLAPLLRGGAEPQGKPQAKLQGLIFAQTATPAAFHRAAVIDGAWKLVVDRGFRPSLFDLRADPEERSAQNQTEAGRMATLQLALGDHSKAGFKTRAGAPPAKQELDAPRRARLRALGYVE